MDKQSEKLIELINTTAKLCRVPMHASIEESYKIISMQIAEYLLENGVIVPPCKVGDEVYFVCLDENCKKFIDKGKVYAISQNENTLWFSVRYLSGLRYDHTADDFGKTVFLSREDAEKALRKEDEGK